MIETKARDEMQSAEVLAKADAAVKWCGHASAYGASVGAKRWDYLLVPHDQVTEAARIGDLLRFKRTG